MTAPFPPPPREYVNRGNAVAADRHYAGMSRLGELLARLHGFITEKRDVRVIRSVEDLNDDKLQAIVAGQCATARR